MDISELKKGDTILVKCKVEAVFEKSGMVMVTTRDCNEGFDAYIDEIVSKDWMEGTYETEVSPDGDTANEFVIENVTAFEREKICDSPDADNITWYPDDLLEIDNVNVVVEGTESDVDKLLQIMGRK